jgi:hypothetical protein
MQTTTARCLDCNAARDDRRGVVTHEHGCPLMARRLDDVAADREWLAAHRDTRVRYRRPSGAERDELRILDVGMQRCAEPDHWHVRVRADDPQVGAWVFHGADRVALLVVGHALLDAAEAT